MKVKTIAFKPQRRHKIDPNKIKTLDDVIQILRRVTMHVDDDGLKGIEHLIVVDDE
ncbi:MULTISPECIES: hypothetical protein [Bacillus cereus group]|uniref:hypothetical protein n=1 Tax=Bacillus cereus group TaxID=86661 RepID=UPI00027914D2|nr:hypothetical protein [Bacillus paranthracis]EJQ03076.1 hypothetical protein IC5_02972 [Bacillus cereus AND1407]SME06390.1 hypothetical protein BACERE00183_01341 [Bacillus cereus]MCC2358853.1 hypothetical protein [Bacillus paranthracis]MDG0911928.1 hypothetical protein [Bacillus paranthracis]MED1078158.1 hypothetical protein [Bacillus paranthracis]